MKKGLILRLLLLVDLLGNTTAWSQAIQSAKQPASLTTGKSLFRPLVQGKDTQGAYSMSELTVRELTAPLHQHKTYTESFYVIAGYLTVYLDGKTQRLGPISACSEGHSPYDEQSGCPAGAISGNRIPIRPF